MTIAFIWEWERASEIEPNWRDGLTGEKPSNNKLMLKITKQLTGEDLK